MATCPLNLKKISKEKARVTVAKDVLARLRYRKVQQRVYLDKRELDNVIWDLEDVAYKKNEYVGNLDAREHINKLEKCPACALGNMLLSHVRIFDKITLYNLDEMNGDRDPIMDVLTDYFSEEQLDLIECAFEGEFWGNGEYDMDLVDKAIVFGNKYLDSKKRLRAIMLNIVKNNGTFKP